MINNKVSNKENHSYSNNKNKKLYLTTDRKREINEYKNFVNNKKRVINITIKEEEKNLENLLSKLSNKFNSITVENLRKENDNFSQKYNQFAKKHLQKIELLVGDLSHIYHKKGYKIPNLQNNLFKINPLLENHTNKIYLSNLSTSRRKALKKENILNSNKAIRYMKKLENIVSPENEKEDNIDKPPKIKKKKIIKKHIKIKGRNKKNKKILSNSIKNLIKLINNNELNNLENQSYFRTRNKFEFNKNKQNEIYKFYNTNAISDSKSNIKNEKLITYDMQNNITNNYDSTIIKRNSLKNATISNFYIDRNNDKINNISYKNKNKSSHSTKKLNIVEIKGFLFNKSNNIKNIIEKGMYLNTEKMQIQSNINIINTPSILKNQNSSKNKSNNITKPFSTSNENSYLSLKSKIDSRTKNSSSFNIKEFSINSYKTKNNRYNDSSGKVTTSSTKLKFEENLKIDKKIPLEFRIGTPKKLFKNDEEKENIVKNIYKKFNSGDIRDAGKNIKLFLSQVKQFNEKEMNEIMEKYNYQNINSNIQELKNIINDKDIERKSFRLYLRNNDYNRVEPLLKNLNEKDRQIMQFDKKHAKISIKP